MTTLLTGVVAMAVLFAWFGAFALADGKGGCHGDCGACTGDDACALDLDFDLARKGDLAVDGDLERRLP